MTDAPARKLAFSVEEVAELMSVSPSHIRRMVKRGDLVPVPHMGFRVVIPMSELERVFQVSA